MEDERIDIGYGIKAAVRACDDIKCESQFGFIYFDEEAMANLVKLAKESGILKDKPAEPQYEVVEVTSFEGLQVGDDFVSLDDVQVRTIEGSIDGGYAVLTNDVCLDPVHIKLFSPLKVRRKVEAVEPIKGTTTVNDPDGRVDFSSGFEEEGVPDVEGSFERVLSPGKYEVTVRKVQG